MHAFLSYIKTNKQRVQRFLAYPGRANVIVKGGGGGGKDNCGVHLSNVMGFGLADKSLGIA
jgi:hypothetical protein